MTMDMSRERRPGDRFETTPGQDDHEDTEEFLRIIQEHRRIRDPRLGNVLADALRHGDSDGRPYVTRHGTIDLDRSQARTWMLNLPSRGGRHAIMSIRKIRWGFFLAQLALGVGTALHGQDVYAAISQLLNVIGTFDTDVHHLQPPEAALLTVAHLPSAPVFWQDWIDESNKFLADWGVGPKLSDRQDLDFWLNGLQSRGIAVEYSSPNNDLIRIRHLVLLVQW
ncbi:hypothetical protein [Burkholderia gladioli]|uniref:hypothetical protein n=1 Tax=Burkholderia gladioli TaxID=28095 RepID=UPI000CFFAD50|nr:hypothetical protein [Burkholderia gladioli]PRE81357.1 hypothetical protein C6Q13_25230 [Burkholderia gladioli]